MCKKFKYVKLEWNGGIKQLRISVGGGHRVSSKEEGTTSQLLVLYSAMVYTMYHLSVGICANGYPFSQIPANKWYSPHHRTLQYCKVRSNLNLRANFHLIIRLIVRLGLLLPLGSMDWLIVCPYLYYFTSSESHFKV